MERMASAARQIGMMPRRQVHRGLVAAAAWALLGVVVAGCGSVTAASAPGAATPAGGSTSTPAAAGSAAAAASASAAATTAPLAGCASVNQATMVTVSRLIHLVRPMPDGPLMATDRNPVQVRALFRDFCNAVTHPDVPPAVVRCPADFGISYVGVFYDGTRVLARYTYAASGCRQVGIIVGSTTKSTMLAGQAAAAAPHLTADFTAVLHSVQVNPGGPNKPA